MVIIMGSSTGRDYATYVNESNVESVIEQEGKGSSAEKSFWLCPDVKASDVGKSAKLQFEESGVHLRIKLSQQPQDNGQLQK